jgi:hypothetical protein
MGKTYIWPYSSEDEMDDPARDIVSPRLVIGPVRFRRQGGNAFLGAVPLRIRPRAPLLGATAQLLDRLLGDLGVIYVDAQTGDNPIVEIWDPSIVFQHRAALVEFPERNLHSGKLINVCEDIGIGLELTSFKGARGAATTVPSGLSWFVNR